MEGEEFLIQKLIKAKATNKQNHATSRNIGFFFLDYNLGQVRKKCETVLLASNQVLGQVLYLHLVGHGKSLKVFKQQNYTIKAIL